MPKESSPKKLHRDLNTAQRAEPRLRRSIPDSFAQALATKRAQGRPHRYTTSEVRGIIKYVTENRNDYDPRRHRFPTQADYDKARNDAHALEDRVRNERARSLADRIERPPLHECITPRPVAEYIAPPPVLLDFTKHSEENCRKIFKPKVRATLIRVKPQATL